PVDVVADDLDLVPAPVATVLEGTDHRLKGKDALAEKRAVHRPHRRALVVRHLHRVDTPRGVAADTVEQAALPARVPEAPHVAARPPGACRDLARIAERVDEREVLAQRMDHLDGEPDACRRRLGEQRRVGVAVGARRVVPGGAVAATADDDQHVAPEIVQPAERAAHLVEAAPHCASLGAEAAVGAEVRHAEPRRAEQPDGADRTVRRQLGAGEADGAVSEALEVAHVVLDRPPAHHVVTDRESIDRVHAGTPRRTADVGSSGDPATSATRAPRTWLAASPRSWRTASITSLIPSSDASSCPPCGFTRGRPGRPAAARSPSPEAPRAGRTRAPGAADRPAAAAAP